MKSSLTAAKFCTLDENEKITKVWSSNPLFVIGILSGGAGSKKSGIE